MTKITFTYRCPPSFQNIYSGVEQNHMGNVIIVYMCAHHAKDVLY